MYIHIYIYIYIYIYVYVYIHIFLRRNSPMGLRLSELLRSASVQPPPSSVAGFSLPVQSARLTNFVLVIFFRIHVLTNLNRSVRGLKMFFGCRVELACSECKSHPFERSQRCGARTIIPPPPPLPSLTPFCLCLEETCSAQPSVGCHLVFFFNSRAQR